MSATHTTDSTTPRKRSGVRPGFKEVGGHKEVGGQTRFLVFVRFVASFRPVMR